MPLHLFEIWSKLKNRSVLLFLFLWLSIGIAGACKEKKPTDSGTKISDTQTEWPQKTYDFGDIAEGEIVTHTFKFKNTGEHNFVIQKVESGCGCTTVKYDRKPLKTGKEGKIEIEFNSEGRYGKQYKEISIFANVLQKQITLKFTANVK